MIHGVLEGQYWTGGQGGSRRYVLAWPNDVYPFSRGNENVDGFSRFSVILRQAEGFQVDLPSTLDPDVSTPGSPSSLTYVS